LIFWASAAPGLGSKDASEPKQQMLGPAAESPASRRKPLPKEDLWLPIMLPASGRL